MADSIEEAQSTNSDIKITRHFMIRIDSMFVGETDSTLQDRNLEMVAKTMRGTQKLDFEALDEDKKLQVFEEFTAGQMHDCGDASAAGGLGRVRNSATLENRIEC